MTRYVVAQEDKFVNELTYLERGSLHFKRSRVPLTVGYSGEQLIGYATDFERDEATGEVTLDIHLKDETYEPYLKDGSFAVAVHHLIYSSVDDVKHVSYGEIVEATFLLMGGFPFKLELPSQDLPGV